MRQTTGIEEVCCMHLPHYVEQGKFEVRNKLINKFYECYLQHCTHADMLWISYYITALTVIHYNLIVKS